ncbi:MAG: hypothetical protein K6F32_00310, partial [Bacilli bacterium]|nr:hypothetical protein [Bacilli bacterium]
QAAYDALAGKTLAEIKADATLKGYWDSLIGWWQTEPGEELDFFVTSYTYPEVDFDTVGLFVGDNEYELVLVLDAPLAIFKDDGSLSYKAAYDFGGLPLVKKDLYEANKHEPASDGALWTTTYNTSLESSASWGPYMVRSFDGDLECALMRNDNWYGYGMDKYKDQYQADKVIYSIVDSYETAWQSFLAGDITSIGLDVSVAADYKNSQRAVFTGDDYVGSLQLQSSAEALKGRETEGIDKEMMTYVDFRKAISLAINRADYTQKCTTASQPCFGLFNEMHYYDVENAGVYRHEDVAKTVICETYGIDPSDYASLDKAYAAVTGYDLTLARSLVDKAYDEAIAAGTISETDNVVFTFGASVDNESTRRTFNYLKEAFETLAVGTKLEGRLTLELDASFGDRWAKSFRAGAYEICTGGWSGAAWDSGYLLMFYLDPSYMYSAAWDTSAVYLDYNPFQDGNAENVITASLIEWWGLLNGDAEAIAKYGYDFSEGEVDNVIRLGIIAQLEGEILEAGYAIPLYSHCSASLLSYQVDYISTTYNAFVGFGGLRNLRFNYTDAEWETVKGSHDYTV